jgi:hypothetical protein
MLGSLDSSIYIAQELTRMKIGPKCLYNHLILAILATMLLGKPRKDVIRYARRRITSLDALRDVLLPIDIS